jgi:hypothetical protein
VKPGGPGWCRFGLASRPRPREGEASGSGQFVGKWKKSIPNLIFGFTRVLEIKSRSFWGQEGLVKIPKKSSEFYRNFRNEKM